MRINLCDTYAGLLEACYRNDTPEAWAPEFLARLTHAVPHAAGASLGATTLKGDSLSFLPLAAHGDPAKELVNTALQSIAAFDLESYRNTWYPPEPVATITSVRPRVSREAASVVDSGLRLAGCRDMLGVLLYPAPGEAFAITLPISNAAEEVLPVAVKRELEEVRLHVEAALVLRQQTNGPVAIIRDDGRLLHVAAEHHASPLEQMGFRVRELERTRRWSSEAGELLTAWRRLIEGRYLAVEHLDTDGRRVYLVYENAAKAAEHRELEPTERALVELLANQAALKDVAEILTLETSKASLAQTRARQKMGFQSVAHLARFARLANGTATREVPWHKLPPSLREVLKLAISGYSIEEISSFRSSQPNTVRNQLAALRRDHKIVGRLGFASLAMPYD